MANSVSGQDEENPVSDWLPEWVRWAHLARSVPAKKELLEASLQCSSLTLQNEAIYKTLVITSV